MINDWIVQIRVHWYSECFPDYCMILSGEAERKESIAGLSQGYTSVIEAIQANSYTGKKKSSLLQSCNHVSFAFEAWTGSHCCNRKVDWFKNTMLSNIRSESSPRKITNRETAFSLLEFDPPLKMTILPKATRFLYPWKSLLWNKKAMLIYSRKEDSQPLPISFCLPRRMTTFARLEWPDVLRLALVNFGAEPEWIVWLCGWMSHLPQGFYDLY